MCLGLAAGCVGSCCASCVCSSVKDCQVQHGPASRIPYIFLMFLCCIFAIVMSLYGEKELWSSSLLNTSFSICQTSSCEGDGSVYRTSFTLFVFFIIHAFIVHFVMSFHWLFFMIKFICLVAFLIGTFFIPGTFFNGYSSFARVASGVFLILQIMILITWALDINDKLVGKINDLQDDDDEDETRRKAKLKGYQCLLIFITLALYAGIITMFVYFFKWFYPQTTCNFNQAIIAITIILVIIATILPVVLGTGSIFATSVVSFYMTYLCYAGLSSYPKDECNEWANHRSTASLWIGIIITAAAISYAGFSVSNGNLLYGSNSEDIESKTQKLTANEGVDDDSKDKDINESNYNDVDDKPPTTSLTVSEEEKYKPEQKQNVLFHLCMAFSAVYMCMLYTNWGTNTSSISTAVGRGKISLWVNIGCEWITFVLYIWTVVAPKVCPGRFGIEVD